jgi:hypothetical protein
LNYSTLLSFLWINHCNSNEVSLSLLGFVCLLKSFFFFNNCFRKWIPENLLFILKYGLEMFSKIYFLFFKTYFHISILKLSRYIKK